jgi:hypothetical protein
MVRDTAGGKRRRRRRVGDVQCHSTLMHQWLTTWGLLSEAPRNYALDRQALESVHMQLVASILMYITLSRIDIGEQQ